MTTLLYGQGSEDLAALLEQAGADYRPATLVIPDLQRPYVWQPSDVVRLVDSLLRGWPFGTLLLWSFGHQPTQEIPVPQRHFWQEPDRTGLTDGIEVSTATIPMNRPCRMVLDGQQRLQSLLLAMGGDSWGFRLFDRSWAALLGQKMSRGRNTRTMWSRGQLCLDVAAYVKAAQDTDPADIDYVPLLKWVNALAAQGTDGRSAAGYERPLPSLADAAHLGRYARLSVLWRIAQETTTQKRLDKVQDCLPGQDPSVAMTIVDFVGSLATIRDTPVSYLEIKERRSGMSEAAYNDAIVNVFTRLNSAGRALTHEEITFAWIKSQWPDKKPAASEVFDELFAKLSKHVAFEMNDLVQSIAAVWSVLDRGTHEPDRAGRLLGRGDLLVGTVMRPVVADIARRWTYLSEDLPWVIENLNQRGLRHRQQFLSLASLTAVWAWWMVARAWDPAKRLASKLDTEQYWDELQRILARHADRWFTVTSWAGRWQESQGLERYTLDLSKRWAEIAAESDATKVLATLESFFTHWIHEATGDAKAEILRLEVPRRNRVGEYYIPLWIWHRLDKACWNLSKEQLMLEQSRAQVECQVDHIVPHKWWETNAKTEDDPDPGNDLGNCALLNSNFNIAKSATPVKTFLTTRVTVFKADPAKLGQWASALRITDELLDATERSPTEVQQAVDARTQIIREDLCAFIDGTRTRQDV